MKVSVGGVVKKRNCKIRKINQGEAIWLGKLCNSKEHNDNDNLKKNNNRLICCEILRPNM